jgi:hypothetical protein
VRDEAFRELEREWRATRDVELEQSYVQASVRRGLPRPRLLLAAYLGSSAALGLLGDQGFPEEPNLGAWLAGLGLGRLARKKELARESALRAALAALSLLRAEGQGAADQDAASEIVTRWLRDPSEANRAEVRGLKGAGDPIPDLAAAALAKRVKESARSAAKVADFAVRALRTRHRKNQQLVRSAIYAELLPWALTAEPGV